MENSVPEAPSRDLYVHHAAKRLKCTDRTVRRLIVRGEIPARRKGFRIWVIRLSDLDTFSLGGRRDGRASLFGSLFWHDSGSGCDRCHGNCCRGALAAVGSCAAHPLTRAAEVGSARASAVTF
jgi:excisionase family DNA binding protein